MPSACPGFAAVIPVLPNPAPVWPDWEDCALAPRYCSLFCSWANTAAQTSNIVKTDNASFVKPSLVFITVTNSRSCCQESLLFCDSRKQTISLRILQQDMESSVYQRLRSGFGGGSKQKARGSRVLYARCILGRVTRLFLNGYPQKWTCMFAESHDAKRLGLAGVSKTQEFNIPARKHLNYSERPLSRPMFSTASQAISQFESPPRIL